MSRLYEIIQESLAKGPKTADEIVAEARRAGLTCRPQTIALFLRLSHDTAERDGTWYNKRGSKFERILAALHKAFTAGQTYLPMDRLARFMDEREPVTGDDIAAVCNDSGQYRVQGKLILRFH